MEASPNYAPAPAARGLPDLTRRRLLQVSAVAATAAAATQVPRALPGALAALSPAASRLRRSRFMPLVGQSVRLRAPSGPSLPVRLVSIEDFPGARMSALAGSEDAFILLFHGPRSPRLEQGVMSVSHPRLGRVELLVSPAGSGRRGQDYAAVINRARAPRR